MASVFPRFMASCIMRNITSYKTYFSIEGARRYQAEVDQILRDNGREDLIEEIQEKEVTE